MFISLETNDSCGSPASDRGLPERTLMRAVLEDAIRCLQGGGSPVRERMSLARDARNWVESRDPRWPYSFENVCEALEVDASRLRQRLLAMTPSLEIRTPQILTTVRRSAVAEGDVVRMIRDGQPLRVVAETLGVSVSKVSVLSRGLASRLKAERDAEIVRLRNEGWTHRALAAHFGLSRIRVIRICARREQVAA
jgi:hypothetical protein